MTRRGLKYLLLGGLLAAGMSACNGLQGVQLNSNVLQGLGGGFPKQPAQNTVAPDAPPEVEAQPLDATASASDTQTTAAAAQPVSQPVAQPAAQTQPSAPSFNGGGKTVAGLGDPGRDGLWMETPLVADPRRATVTAPNGRSVVVTLEPISGDKGAGSRLSIGAMRALGLPLTELVEVRVGPA